MIVTGVHGRPAVQAGWERGAAGVARGCDEQMRAAALAKRCMAWSVVWALKERKKGSTGSGISDRAAWSAGVAGAVA